MKIAKRMLALLLVICAVCLLAACGAAKQAETGEPLTLKTMTERDRKAYYLDFAAMHRLDFLPYFTEADLAEPVEANGYAVWAFYLQQEKLPENLTMKAELVEDVMRDYLGVQSFTHASLPRAFYYDAEENAYLPMAAGLSNKPIFDTVAFETAEENGKTVYRVTLRQLAFPFDISEKATLGDAEYAEYERLATADTPEGKAALALLDAKGEELKNGKTIYAALSEMIIEGTTGGMTDKQGLSFLDGIVLTYTEKEDGSPIFLSCTAAE